MSRLSSHRLKLKLELKLILAKLKDRLELLAFESPSAQQSSFVNLDEENAQLQMILHPFQTLPYLKSEVRIELLCNISFFLLFLLFFPGQVYGCFTCDPYLSVWLIILTLLNTIGIMPNLLTLWKLSYYSLGMDPTALMAGLYLVMKSNVYAYMSNLTHLKFFMYLIGTFRVWLLARRDCENTYLLPIAYLMIASFFIRIFYSFVRFNLIFGGLRTQDEMKGFTQEEIEKGFEKMEYFEGVVMNSSCSICLEDFGKGELLKKTTCLGQHWFHVGCIDKWLSENRTCPNCNCLIGVEKIKEN